MARAEKKKDTNEISFEEALKELELVLSSMEKGEVPLAELVAKYEQGKKLLAICQTQLSEAQLKILAIKEKPGGKVTLEPFKD